MACLSVHEGPMRPGYIASGLVLVTSVPEEVVPRSLFRSVERPPPPSYYGLVFELT